jgi:hypothetical protein
MEIFEAGVQYGDLKGSSAADHADMKSVDVWLKENEHIDDGENVLGISMSIGENNGEHRDPVFVTFLVSGLKGHKSYPEMIEASGDKITARKIDVEMNIVDFLGLFKRLEITLSTKSCLEGKSYTCN